MLIDPSPEEYEYDPYKDCRPLQASRYRVEYCNKGTWAKVSVGWETKSKAMASVNYDMLNYRVVDDMTGLVV